MTAADSSILAELHFLLDCVHTDGTIRGLDEFDRDGLSTLGQTLYDVLVRMDRSETALANMSGAFDTPLVRLAMKQFWNDFHDEAIASSRDALKFE